MNEPTLSPANGPANPQSDPAGVGLLNGVPVVRYEFRGTGGRLPLPTAGAPQPGQVRRMAIFPESTVSAGVPNFGAAAFTLLFDGQPAVDQHGHTVGGTPTGPEGEPIEPVPCWMPDQWTLIDLTLPEGLEGSATPTLELVVPDGVHGVGYLQDAGWVTPERTERTAPVDWVQGTRGSHSRTGHSRGNTLPLACRPHGFTHLTPLTDARSRNWLYQWAPDGGPRLQALAFSHCPSPWIAERGSFQLMPFTGFAQFDPVARSRAFDHAHERDGVHHYRVELDGPTPADAIVAEMTPTSHAGVFRFTFADTERDRGVLLDAPGLSHIELLDLPDGGVAIEAWVAAPPDQTHAFPEPGFYFYGETRQRARVLDDHEPNRWRRLVRRVGRGFFGRRPAQVIGLVDGDVLEIALGTSSLSIDQARANLAAEVGTRRFDEVLEESASEWNALLGALTLSDDATDDQRISAYSNLARLHSWPNAAHETTPDGRVAYASPFRPPVPGPAQRATAHQVVEGRLYVNNGFWDTYRTAWPHYTLFSPETCQELLTGTVQQFHDGGWTARWSGAGYIDCMPGASADVVFADAAAHGLTFDELAAHDSAVRNGSVPAPNRFVGRKGLSRSRYTAFTASDTPEGMSWQLENALTNDAVGRWSASLAERAEALGAPERRDEFLGHAAWFAQRAMNYRNHFDPAVRFFQGRLPDGSWRHTPDTFDPRQWGRDYTETNAWGMAVSAWHDAQGLAALYGGEAGLAARLDAMFATPEPGDAAVAGGYSDVIHEMREARSVRCGQVSMSNQPAHHIPFMYLHVGAPHKTQWWTREMLDRLFVGSEIGQGYPGDEDNGEMSAWWLWAAMGLYPLLPGSGELVITAPLLREMSFDRGAHGRLTVRTDHPEFRFIQAVRLNGEPWAAVSVPVSRLAGDVTIEVELGPEPSDWGAHTRPLSANITGEQAWHDRSAGATVARLDNAGVRMDAGALVDDVGVTPITIPAGGQLVVEFDQPLPVRLFTLTSPDQPADPAWRLEAVDADGGVRVLAPARAPQWPDQTMPFLLDGQPASEVRLMAERELTLTQIEVWS